MGFSICFALFVGVFGWLLFVCRSCVAKADFEPITFLTPPPKCRDYGCVPLGTTLAEKRNSCCWLCLGLCSVLFHFGKDVGRESAEMIFFSFFWIPFYCLKTVCACIQKSDGDETSDG